MKFILTGLYKQFIKNMGRTPNSSELKMLKKQAIDIEQSDNIIKFPAGGKDKISPFKPRPKKSLDEFKKTEDIYEQAQDLKSFEKDVIDTLYAPIKPDLKVVKPGVNPKLTELENIKKIKVENKEAAKRFKEKMNKNKTVEDFIKDGDYDPSGMAAGGLAGLLGEPRSEYGAGGGTGAPPITYGEAPPITYGEGINIPGSPKGIPTGKIGPVDIGMYGGGGYSKNQEVPGVNRATTNQDLGITAEMPIGDSGFSVGGNYMKSRTNERFTGEAIPGQTFKNVPTDSDRFNVGINFRKQFANGGIGFSEGSRGFDIGKFREQMIQDMIKKSPDGIVMDGEKDTSILDSLRGGGAKTLDPSFPPVEYDDGTVYFPETDEYYKMDGTQVDGISPGAKPVPKVLEAAQGGRIGLKDGGMDRRSFLKLMGGLASIPILGRFIKPVAKVAETAAPAVAEGVKLGYDKFLMLVDKIKKLGRKTDAVTQKEREVGYVYKGKDGNEYELVEDITTGDVRVTKDKPGGESFDTIEDRSTFVLRRNQVDETTKGRKPPDEYDEMKEIPGPDGTFDDIDEVSDISVKEVLEELGETKIKKAGGGIAHMLGE